MKIVSPIQTKAWDQTTIAQQGITSTLLMDRAANTCANWIIRHFDPTTVFYIFCGHGNNGGDGLALARLLQPTYQVSVYFIADATSHYSPDFIHQMNLLKTLLPDNIFAIDNADAIPGIEKNVVLIDALLGTGRNRAISGLYGSVVNVINASGCQVIAIDLPSGMETQLEEMTEPIIRAQHTLVLEVPKLRMLFSESYDYTGELHILPIGMDEISNSEFDSSDHFITAYDIRKCIKPRKKFDHKGVFGHALIIAGSYGKMGAAVLCAKSCMRSGVGLLTVACPHTGVDILQTSVPEAMVYSIEEHEKYISFFPKITTFKAIGIGPGIEKRPITRLMVRNLLLQKDLPGLIIDADGINLLAEIIQESPDFIIPKNTILTPHVKEFDRLVGTSQTSIERHHRQLSFSIKHQVFIVLKGAYTCITTPEGISYFNSTGNPGMATAGSGDVLTGLITGMFAQGYNHLQACMIGVYIHGLAGDIASTKYGEASMTSSDIISELGNAFIQIYKE